MVISSTRATLLFSSIMVKNTLGLACQSHAVRDSILPEFSCIRASDGASRCTGRASEYKTFGVHHLMISFIQNCRALLFQPFSTVARYQEGPAYRPDSPFMSGSSTSVILSKPDGADCPCRESPICAGPAGVARRGLVTTGAGSFNPGVWPEIGSAVKYCCISS